MTDRIRSINARPGDLVRHEDGHEHRILRRKDDSESFLPGWWLVGGGGLADKAIDEPEFGWTIVREATNG